MTAALRLTPIRLTILASTAAHAALLAMLAYSASSAVERWGKVEVSYVPAQAGAVVNKPRVPARPRAPVAPLKNESRAEALAPPSAAPAASKSVPSEGAPGAPGYDSYAAEVARELNRRKMYPEVSMRLRQQGRVKVRFRVQRDGKVLQAEILERSAHDPLNNAARKLIEDIHNFKPFPDDIKETTWLFTVPIEYTM